MDFLSSLSFSFQRFYNKTRNVNSFLRFNSELRIPAGYKKSRQTHRGLREYIFSPAVFRNNACGFPMLTEDCFSRNRRPDDFAYNNRVCNVGGNDNFKGILKL